MQESLGTLLYAPWIYMIIAACTLLDVFLPLLPSGALVVAAAAIAAGTAANVAGEHLPELFLIILSAATASFLGDLAAYHIARHGESRLGRALARSRRLAAAHQYLDTALSRGGGALVVLARFAPAGRAVVSFGAGATQRRAREFLPWSAVAAVAWTGYSVAVGYIGGQVLGSGWLSVGLSLLSLFATGLIATHTLRRFRTPEQG